MDEIIKNVLEVNSNLGNYYKENVYQSALSVELQMNGKIIQSEVVVPIIYKGVNIGFERADIVLYEDGILKYIIELKSQSSRLSSKEINQLRKYLINLNCENGILVNFYDKLEMIHVDKINHRKISDDTSSLQN